MRYVIDSSLALSWCFPDEFNEAARAAYQLAEHSSLIVPPLWHIEIGNVLGTALRKGRIDLHLLNRALGILRRLRIETAHVSTSDDISLILHFMRANELTAYDSLYVELAKQLHLPLGTLDRQMARSFRAAGISLVAEPVS